MPDTLATALDDRVQRMAVAQTSLRSPQPRRGLTSHRIQIHRRNPPARAIGVRTKRKSVRPAANLIRCPEGCGAFLNPRNVKRHLSKVHGEGFPLDRMKIRVPQPPLPADETEHKHESCPVCDASVRTDQLPAHIAKAHKHPPENSLIPRLLHAPTSNIYSGARLPRSAAPGSANSPVREKIYKICPVCDARVGSKKFQKHMERVHKKRQHMGSRSTRAKKVIVQSAKDMQRETTSLVAPRDRNLDATKLYAHSYRERGRFGSHPSHDGFDDESGPDEKR